MPAPRIALLAPSLKLLDWAAARIIEQHPGPDLSGTTVLLPSTGGVAPLRDRLLAYAGGALLGPQILTLAAFAEERGEAPPALSALDCKLQLAEALSAHLHLFPQQEATQLADDFFLLFEELSANLPELADDPERFLLRVTRGYGGQRHGAVSAASVGAGAAPTAASRTRLLTQDTVSAADLKLFSDEARQVHLLWRAWMQQSNGASPAASYARRLSSALEQHSGPLYLIGFDQFSRSEAAALRKVLAREQVHLWLHGRREGRDGAATAALCAQLGIEPEVIGATEPGWLDHLLQGGAALSPRLQANPPPGLRIQAARSPEHEALIADVAIRQWLLAGAHSIAVISQDRRFARRLRALLERAGIALRDEAGWALSTSSAAAALMHWLDCVEQGFHFRPLLALLRSHFHDPLGEHSAAVDELERAIYRSKTVSGLKRLHPLTESASALLGPLEAAARHLVLHAGSRPAQQWSAALLQSLQALPLWTHFPEDSAGHKLVELLHELDAGLSATPLRLDWSGFRRLLQRLLEQATFAPGSAPSPVRLLTLEQAAALDCDALLLSGAAAGKFPGISSAATLFNQAVRAELGLRHAGEAQQLALARWRRLLDAAPEVLITYAAEDEGEAAQSCAWVELLQSVGAADAAALAALAGSAEVDIAQREPHTLQPLPAPRPPAAAALLPPQLSATAHQSLVDCPYRFQASSMLGLYAPQEPDEPYSRRDFGERVHTVLSHFTQPVSAAERAETEARMAVVATEVFAPDLRARALTRAWLAEFEGLIPDIVGWLIERGGDWPLASAEATLKALLDERLELKGRVDRLEQRPNGEHCVVDYKTGAAPKKIDVENGEAVQATHYALIAEHCMRVEYLQLKRDEFKAPAVSGDALEAARVGVRERLLAVQQALRAGAPMPAHGDAATCEHCDYSGLCRKGAWADA